MNNAIAGDRNAQEEHCYSTKQLSLAGHAIPRRLWHRRLAFCFINTGCSSTFPIGTYLDRLPAPLPENILSRGDLHPEVKLRVSSTRSNLAGSSLLVFKRRFHPLSANFGRAFGAHLHRFRSFLTPEGLAEVNWKVRVGCGRWQSLWWIEWRC